MKWIVLLSLVLTINAFQPAISKLSPSGHQFQPANYIELLATFHNVHTIVHCAMLSYQNSLCRTYDYDSNTQQCRLFEGSVDTGTLLSTSLSSSVVGWFDLDSSLFSLYNAPASQCTDNRFLYSNGASNRCECPSHTFWNGSMCINQRFSGEVCVNSDWCRNDLSLYCISATCTVSTIPPSFSFASTTISSTGTTTNTTANETTTSSLLLTDNSVTTEVSPNEDHTTGITTTTSTNDAVSLTTTAVQGLATNTAQHVLSTMATTSVAIPMTTSITNSGTTVSITNMTTSSTTSISSTTSTTSTTACVPQATTGGVLYSVTNPSSTNYPNYACYAYVWTATSSSATLSFAFRNDPGGWMLDDVQVYHGSTQLIQNGGFETGNLNGWNYSGSCLVNQGTVRSINGCAKSGSYYYYDPCTLYGDTISQTFSTVTGDAYNIIFWLTNTVCCIPAQTQTANITLI